MDRSALYQLADRVLDGTLEDRLRTWVEAGVSRRAAARLLAKDLQVELDPQTVQRWMREVAP